ncbi:MAG: ribonuclease Z [Halobacteriaceae archaeon]
MSLYITFLGTSGAVPTTKRNPSSIFVNREGDGFLFDVGEGTQRQMMRFGTGFDISDIFITHLHGDHVFGLPGLIQTWDFSDREKKLRIHAPRSGTGHVDDLIHTLGNVPDFPIAINGIDPGDKVIEREEYEVRSYRTEHRADSVGYVVEESERRGRFDRERAEELGVPVGPKFSKLHRGEPVELEDGRVVQPNEVVGPPRPGRCLVYTGDTRPVESTVSVAESADLLIHDATFSSDAKQRAKETGHSTAREAGRIASEAGVSRLALTHISSRYSGDASILADEAAVVFDGKSFVPTDGQSLDIPFPSD